jgi:hypothetical protein
MTLGGLPYLAVLFQNNVIVGMKLTITCLMLLLFAGLAFGQGGTVRGVVYDKDSGDPVPFAYVLVLGTTTGTVTDVDGFYNIPNLDPGELNLSAFSIGYDTTTVQLDIREGRIKNQNFIIGEAGINLEEVNISARRNQDRTETRVSVINITPQQIKSLPSTGGDADIAQYLTVLPGVISSGDQGGQLYIRGGSPVQNQILLDGMTIYRPFHSIGLYSVFETEAIKNVEVHSGGFNAEYGGRISAIVDMTTKQGDKKRLSGIVGASPFQGRMMLEGPIKKFTEASPSSVSLLLSAKHSILDQTSKSLYEYASPDSNGLPFTYTDFYGKLSIVSDNGSSFEFFGFNFKDDVNYLNVADIGWKSTGGGMNFNLIPPNSNLIFGGNVSYSSYDIELVDSENNPRRNELNDLNIKLDFKFFGFRNELNYGIDVNAISTDFGFTNFLNLNFDQKVNNTNIAAFFKYKQILGNVIVEPGIRLQYYAGQSEFSVEPRLSMKWNITDAVRFKMAGGFYSQNLVSTVSERDIVNLFVGYLSSPEGILRKPNSTEEAGSKLQKSIHAVAGLEVDLGSRMQVNIEPYYKRFTQLISLNRNKLTATDPNYVTETGDAQGLDLSLSYKYQNIDIWSTYSLGFVNRDNGVQEFSANFDRRHNINLLTTYSFGQNQSWSASFRWNMGTGFPFTQVNGFYGYYSFFNTTDFDYIEGNPDITPIFDETINKGRLPDYHRLDISLKKRISFSKYTKLNITAALTNAYDRENIFYLDVLTLDRVNQLPILPSLGLELSF